MIVSALSMPHYRTFMESSVGPIEKLFEGAAGSPERLDALRREFDSIAEPFYHDNVVRHEYLLTHAAAA